MSSPLDRGLDRPWLKETEGNVGESEAFLPRAMRHRGTSYDSCDADVDSNGDGKMDGDADDLARQEGRHFLEASSSGRSRIFLFSVYLAVTLLFLLSVHLVSPETLRGVGERLQLIESKGGASQKSKTMTNDDAYSSIDKAKSPTASPSWAGRSGDSLTDGSTTETSAAAVSVSSTADTMNIYSSSSSTASTTVFDLSNKVAISNGGNLVSVQPMPTEPIEFDLARDGYDVIETLSEDYLKYSFLDHYDAVIEPYASMNLVVDGMNETSVYYRFSICPYDSTNTLDCRIGALSPTGSPEVTTAVNITCAAYDKYYIYVTEFDLATEKMTRTTTGTGICMYVRREIRSLSDEDLSATMDAMYALWEYSQDEGEELYGEYFMAASTLLKFHHFNSAWQDADHIHEGNGFILQHIKQTNIFEKSMQQVDPSVSLPYWDFTIESANGTAIWESEIFSADVFGSMPNCSDPWWGFQSWEDIEDARIPDGRWANIKADWNTEYDDLLAGYGYMRAPWSMNPSPYVSRFTTDWQIGTTLPRCSSHYGMLEYTDLMDFLMDAGDDPHSSAHSLIGGMYGCDYFSPLLAANLINDHSGMMTICGKWAFVMKELYRNNLVAPLTNCSTNTYECGFECLNEDDDSGDLLFLVKELISDSVPETLSVPQWEKWEDFICSGDGYKVVPGDHLESASPTDPSFWPIHPTLERLLQAKFMSGGFENNTWHFDPETENVCHHASCYEASLNGTAFYPECCYGHFQFDQMLNALTGSKYEYYGPTNDAILSGTNPTGMYTMPYIYDKFDWSHCIDVDVDFDDLLDTFYKTYVTMEDDYMDDIFNSTANVTMHTVHTPAPTREPTEFPTARPSHSPDTTKKPTFEPTEKPTHSPDSTRPPTREPTEHPSPKPTHSPDYTHKPTFEPTDKPTRSPDFTHFPTHSPDWTPEPSFFPTMQPTFYPTVKPTRSPDATHSPTYNLDELPGNSYPPTFEPTFAPTHSPEWSAEPSFEPSAVPTHTANWTAEPSVQPSEFPTHSPDWTANPSMQPTELPTHAPDWTPPPSTDPTFEPTGEPSVPPTPAPSSRFDLFVTAETALEDKSNPVGGLVTTITTATTTTAARSSSKSSKSSKSKAESRAEKKAAKKAEKKAEKKAAKDKKKSDTTDDKTDDKSDDKKSKKASKKSKKERSSKNYKTGDANSRRRLRDF